MPDLAPVAGCAMAAAVLLGLGGSGSGRVRRALSSSGGRAAPTRSATGVAGALPGLSPMRFWRRWSPAWPWGERGPAEWVMVTLAAAGAVALGRSAAAGVAAGVVGGVVLALRRRAVRGRREAETRAAVSELCGALSAELRAGRSAAEALDRSADREPLSSLLAGPLVATRVGGDVVRSLQAVSVRPGAEALRRVAACWSVAGTSGAGLAAALSRLSESLRAEEAARHEIMAQVAAARATVQLLAGLPVLALLLGNMTGADPVFVLLHTPVGLGCLALGLALTVTGLFWSERLIHAADRRA